MKILATKTEILPGMNDQLFEVMTVLTEGQASDVAAYRAVFSARAKDRPLLFRRESFTAGSGNKLRASEAANTFPLFAERIAENYRR